MSKAVRRVRWFLALAILTSGACNACREETSELPHSADSHDGVLVPVEDVDSAEIAKDIDVEPDEQDSTDDTGDVAAKPADWTRWVIELGGIPASAPVPSESVVNIVVDAGLVDDTPKYVLESYAVQDGSLISSAGPIASNTVLPPIVRSDGGVYVLQNVPAGDGEYIAEVQLYFPGENKWTWRTEFPKGINSGAAALGVNDEIYVVADGKLCRVDADGTLTWAKPLPFTPDPWTQRGDLAPSVSSAGIWLAGEDGILRVFDSEGEVIHQHPIPVEVLGAGPVLTDSGVTVGGGTWAIALTDAFEVDWLVKGNLLKSQTLTSTKEDVLMVATGKGLKAVDASGVKWSYYPEETGQGMIFAPTVLSDGTLLAFRYGPLQDVVRFTNTGEVIWSRKLPLHLPIGSRPWVLSDTGTLFYLSGNKLVALATDFKPEGSTWASPNRDPANSRRMLR